MVDSVLTTVQCGVNSKEKELCLCVEDPVTHLELRAHQVKGLKKLYLPPKAI